MPRVELQTEALMDSKEKKELSETDIKVKFITPAIVNAGWDEIAHIRREITLTPGPTTSMGFLKHGGCAFAERFVFEEHEYGRWLLALPFRILNNPFLYEFRNGVTS